ncbi:hypothetical protein niasHT_025435 [Heterodera trifolii]|uniref:Tyrosine-protein kinase n=1 Tax=Heterodera trifolii TaxID=157864 RepID=A0ABD2JX11_9BILA
MEHDEQQMLMLPYYHGMLLSEDAEEFLLFDGNFLVRKTEEISDDGRVFALSVNVAGRVSHVVFRRRRHEGMEGMYTIEGNPEGFLTIEQFVNNYLGTGTSIISGQSIFLRRPIERAGWEISRDAITLDRGGFVVFTPRKPGKKIRVTVKEMSQTSSKERIREFMHEMRILRQLNHRNIIQFHGVALQHEPLMMVIEDIEEATALTDYLRTQRRCVRAKLNMCLGAAGGLSHIHSRGIVHGDIAARNCIYLRSRRKVKISNFEMAFKGTAKMYDIKWTQRKWLSPELQIDGLFTSVSDTWSYGVLCWEIFHDGNEPYPQMEGREIARLIQNGGGPTFSNETPPTIVEFFKQFVLSRRSERYSMESVYEWLKQNIN